MNAPRTSAESIVRITAIVALCAFAGFIRGAIAQGPPAQADRVRILDRVPDAALLVYRRSLREARPPLRGFRAAILDQAQVRWPFDPPGPDAPPEIRRAAAFVSERLAVDGLLPTLAGAIEIIGVVNFNRGDEADTALLRQVGIPVDLLACFPAPPSGQADSYAVVRHAMRQLVSGRRAEELKSELESLPFEFAVAIPGFRAATDCGEHEIAALRLQLTRGDYWHGIGDGCALDMATQLVAALPDAEFTISIERRFLRQFLAFARQWPLTRPGQLTIVPEDFVVGQWAQDNGKTGFVVTEPSGARAVATIVPRYASRGEDGSTFVPGESFLAEGFACAGHRVVQSRLLFQGGNLIAVREPRTGERVLLIGEAEIHRNRALGLSELQTILAFNAEFGVDRSVVLPATAYHIDYEVSVRTQGEEVLAFVNDEQAAARNILAVGAEVLKRGRVLEGPAANEVEQLLAGQRGSEAAKLCRDALARRSNSYGQYPQSAAELFSTSLVDSGVGNFQGFLLALDILSTEDAGEKRAADDPAGEAYRAALHRIEKDRRDLQGQLSLMGWKTIAVPSLAHGNRGINYLNGLHDRTRYFMPAYGGCFKPLDEAAASVFREALGPSVSVIPTLCSESQRRVGAVRCAASVLPRPN